MNYQAEILKIRKQRGVSVIELADYTGIPKERIYKWESGKGNPKAEDAAKLRLWVNGRTEDVPHETAVNDPEMPFRAHKTDYQDKYIGSLERENLRLRNDLETSLAAIHRDILVGAGIQAALMEILLLLASERKGVYTKASDILRKHKLEGMLP